MCIYNFWSYLDNIQRHKFAIMPRLPFQLKIILNIATRYGENNLKFYYVYKR